MTAIYAGSFDPLTNGHLDIIQRAAKIFDAVFVVVATNPNKTALLTEIERLTLIKESIRNLDGKIEVYISNELTATTAKNLGAGVMVRGLRSVSDFEYELNLAQINKSLVQDLETIFIPCNSSLSWISSSMIKELLKYNQDISAFVPECVLKYLCNPKVVFEEREENVKNLAIIYQPHYLTRCARVKCENQMDPKKNYVIICCSESQNGCYEWDASKKDTYEVWMNGKTPCYCVPLQDLTFVKRLDELDNSNPVRAEVIKMQKAWWNGEVRNGKAHKTDSYPSYFLT